MSDRLVEVESSNYYVNKNPQDSGDHEVHREDCKKLPSPANREYLGHFDCCEDAVEKAKQIFPQSNGCFHCSEECHTSKKHQLSRTKSKRYKKNKY